MKAKSIRKVNDNTYAGKTEDGITFELAFKDGYADIKQVYPCMDGRQPLVFAEFEGPDAIKQALQYAGEEYQPQMSNMTCIIVVTIFAVILIVASVLLSIGMIHP